MSAILMAVAALCEGLGPKDVCAVERKNTLCGTKLLCHLPEEVIDVSKTSGVYLPDELYPRRWLCPVCLLSKILEQEQQSLTLAMAGYDPVAAFFPDPTSAMLKRYTQKKTAASSLNKLPNTPIQLIRYLEENDYYCYNLILRRDTLKPPVLLYSYAGLNVGINILFYLRIKDGEYYVSKVSSFSDEHSSWQVIQQFYTGGRFETAIIFQ